MTALHLADAREAADLAAFLARLIHYDRAAAVRVQAGGGVLAVFGRPAPFEVLAVRTARLADTGAPGSGAEPGRAGAPGPAAAPGPGTSSAPGPDAGSLGSHAVSPGPDSASANPGAVPAAGAGPRPRVPAGGGASGSGPAAGLDVTVSAGQLADAIDAAVSATGSAPPGAVSEAPDASGVPDATAAPAAPAAPDASGVPAGVAAAVVTVPDAVTGPPWAGVLPPRGGWRRVPGLPGPEALHRAIAAAVAEFRERDAALPEERRTRTERDRIGREIWSRTLGDTGLPLRAAHAAQSLGFLRPVRSPAAAVAPGGAAAGPGGAPAGERSPEAPVLLAAGGWLRLRTPYGSIAVRSGGLPGLSVTPA